MITEKLHENMLILFIGFNPSLTSYECGFNYAGKNNRFYTVLYQSGITTRLYAPEESHRLLIDYGYGFTNIVTRPTKRADELTKADYDHGRVVLHEKLCQYKPVIACYVGKGVYEQFSHPRKKIPWGFQPTSIVNGILDFVGPSTSGLVRMKLCEQVCIYAELAAWLR